MQSQKNSYILIEKYKIWQLDEAYYNDSQINLGIEIGDCEEVCGILFMHYSDKIYQVIPEIEKQLGINMDDYYIYYINDKNKFIFGQMKYNLDYLVVPDSLICLS